MSPYEKIATVIIAILLIPMIFFSMREIKEPPEQNNLHRSGPSFGESLGPDFKLGPFTKIVSTTSSGGTEEGCEDLQSVVTGVLHDIKVRLERLKVYTGVEDAFEVNTSTLQLFCKKTATITLADSAGNTLVLQKVPFVKAVPQGGEQEDIGTDVRINATFVPLGTPMPAQPTTFGDVLIPDRFLDTAASSSR